MRILILHVDYFRCEITEKGRSKVIEEYTSPITEIKEALIVLSSVEKQDESDPEKIAQMAVKEIAELAEKVKTKNIVLHPSAHLFGELSKPDIAIRVLKIIEAQLTQENFRVVRTPFGWFNTLEIKAKGHPLSRVARILSVEKPNSTS